jgi:hypothetical protein
MQPGDRSFTEITSDLEALKVALIGMSPQDIAQLDAEAMAREISAIRLHLKRLELDRAAANKRYDVARDKSL